tara:strand:- start:390 stop:512 length:123 start_codon:yes stop_codon:yes gene_type:complete
LLVVAEVAEQDHTIQPLKLTFLAVEAVLAVDVGGMAIELM